MKNVVLSILAKISKMDAATKQLSARLEAQSLLIGALVLAVRKSGGVTNMIESVNKAINSVLNSAEDDDGLKSDAAILLGEFQELLAISRLIESEDSEVDHQELSALALAADADLENKK
ncbi:anti-adapter protein IraP [Duffyella gerundensis]|uniref:anti-adapter protein IraP n=1 Tax=Duffyella TaxID=3026546 RepID=UPI003F6E1789